MNRFAHAVAPMMLLFSLSICLSAQTPTDWRFTPLLSESLLTLANGSSVYPGLPVMSGNTLTFAGYKPDFFDPSGIYQSNSGTITKIADTRTRIPNDGRRFDHFGGSLIANGDQVAFTGAPTSNGGEGVYLSQSGNLSVIADSSTTLPGSTAKLASAYFAGSHNNINSERLLFNAFGNGTNGLYSREKTAL